MLRPKTIRAFVSRVSQLKKNDDKRNELECMQIPAQKKIYLFTFWPAFPRSEYLVCIYSLIKDGKDERKNCFCEWKVPINTCALSFQAYVERETQIYVKTCTHRQYSFSVFCLICSLENRFPWSIHLVKKEGVCYVISSD